ncbi:MAG TPA: potassium-transporting ATPase subunit C [Acidimicrobiales bacterium]|nr:potassium-transporting ATPase subunit C [Acidimicrobiales bacterium]
MITHLRRSLISIVVMTVLFGFLYAFAGTGLAQSLFSHQANGSITANGSTLVGQNWSQAPCPGHLAGTCVFQGRPDNVGPYAPNPKASPTGSGGNNPLGANNIPGEPHVANAGESGATNLGPRSHLLLTNTQQLIAYWHQRGVNPTPDLVTTSASGVDPDISPDDAYAQIPMVSKATGISPARLRSLIGSQTHGAQLGFLGSPYIVVLQLNEALARLK